MPLPELMEAGRQMRRETASRRPLSVSFNYCPDRRPVRFTIDYPTFAVLLACNKVNLPHNWVIHDPGDAPDDLQTELLDAAKDLDRLIRHAIILGRAFENARSN
jgi:hypothetical protein